jgi:hypothetical protein
VRDNDGRKLDHKTFEVLRIRAVEQVGAGAYPEVVADALGLHRKTVYGWLAKYREGGKDTLRARPVPARPSKLEGRQIELFSPRSSINDVDHAGWGGASAGGSHGPVVNSRWRASSWSRPHFLAVDR